MWRLWLFEYFSLNSSMFGRSLRACVVVGSSRCRCDVTSRTRRVHACASRPSSRVCLWRTLLSRHNWICVSANSDARAPWFVTPWNHSHLLVIFLCMTTVNFQDDRKKVTLVTPQSRQLPFEAQRLLSWYSHEWDGQYSNVSPSTPRLLCSFFVDLQRNEFIHKFMLKLDPRQHYFISSFLAVSWHKNSQS